MTQIHGICAVIFPFYLPTHSHEHDIGRTYVIPFNGNPFIRHLFHFQFNLKFSMNHSCLFFYIKQITVSSFSQWIFYLKGWKSNYTSPSSLTHWIEFYFFCFPLCRSAKIKLEPDAVK